MQQKIRAPLKHFVSHLFLPRRRTLSIPFPTTLDYNQPICPHVMVINKSPMGNKAPQNTFVPITEQYVALIDIERAPLTSRSILNESKSILPPSKMSSLTIGSCEPVALKTAISNIKPFSAKLADRDWQWLMMVISILMFVYAVGWLLCMLLQAVAISTSLGAQVLSTLLRFKQGSGTILGAGICLGIVFGGHRFLMAPACLCDQSDPQEQQLAQDRPNKVARVQRVKEDRHRLLYKQVQQQGTSGAAALADLACSPIHLICGSSHFSAAINTAINCCSPITFLINVTPVDSAASSLPDVVIENTKSSGHALTQQSGGTSVGKDSNTNFRETKPEVLPDKGAAGPSIASVATNAQEGTSPQSGESSTQTKVETTLASDNTLGLYTNRCYDASKFLTNVTATVVKQSCVASRFTRSLAKNSAEGSSFNSHDSLSSTAYDSQGSTDSSFNPDNGGVSLQDCFIDGKNGSDVCSNSEGVENIIITASRPGKRTQVDLAHLFDLVWIHGNPRFHEGPLYEVEELAWDRRKQEVKSTYGYDTDATMSDVTGLESSARPVSEDQKDIKRMLDDVHHLLPAAWQEHLAQNGSFELSRSRDGVTGLNFFIQRLELLWYEQRPLLANGVAIPVADLNVIHDYQKFRARNFRPACPPDMLANLTSHSTHRQYLTDEQVVKINEGCPDYGQYNEIAYKCDALIYLERHQDHAGAKIANPVLGWLDDMEGVDFYDPNGYLPCLCGRRALSNHVDSRNEVEPGYDPSICIHDAVPLHHLDDEALEQDRQRKQDDEEYFGSTLEHPRSQTLAQECPLHAVPTNNLWILMDGVEDYNKALAGANNDLPVPGFTELTQYPRSFRMPQGFCVIKHELLPPRCQHGYLHPPFADHCMGCFPNGEHHDDCAECEAHDAIPAIMQNPLNEREYHAVRQAKDKDQWRLVRGAEQHEKRWAWYAQRSAGYTEYFSGWPVVVHV